MAVRDRREIKRSLFTGPGSEKFWEKTRADRSRLLYLGLICNADDEGKLEGSPSAVKAVLSRANWSLQEIEASLKELAKAKLVIQYRANGKQYLYIVDFVESQSWHGIAERRSKIANPATIKSVAEENQVDCPGTPAPKTHEPHKDYPYPYTYPKETYPKPSGVETGTAAKSSRSLDNGMGPDEAYRMAKRAYRLVVGKSIGSIGNRGG